MYNIRKGSVKNPYAKLKCGGYYGEGNYIANNEIRIYKSWESMLRRALLHENHKSYYKCAVCKEWESLQNFASWYISYRKQLNPLYNDRYQIDKDILQWNKEYKIYSPETCCLVPDQINAMLTGMHPEKNKDIPIGVYPNKYGRYAAYVSNYGNRYSLGTYDTPEEAFEVYKNAKKDLLINAADIYYKDNAITKDIYNHIISLEIK